MPVDAEKPVVLVNYKIYAEATGARAVALTEALKRAADAFPDVTVAVSPQAVDLARVAAVGLPTFAQHVDALKPGSGTGWTLAEGVKDAGATGSLVNHAEHRLTLADIDAAVTRLRDLGLEACVCTNNVPATRAAAALGPAFVAIEPPELIGGDVSVTSADPAIVKDAVNAAKSVDPNVRVLCGAGVKTGKDVRAALDLGAAGVLLASGITKAADPEAALKDLLSGTQ